MSEVIMYKWIIGILVFIMCFLIYKLKGQYNLSKFYHQKWEDFETAYWNLLASEAVDRKTYEIHLPFLYYNENWLRKRTAEEIKNR